MLTHIPELWHIVCHPYINSLPVLKHFLSARSQIKYKENWEKNKSKACDIGLDTLTLKAAKASRDLASDVRIKCSMFKCKTFKFVFLDLFDFVGRTDQV